MVMVAPITETTEIKPPTKRIKGCCVLRYTRAVKTIRAVKPARLMSADRSAGLMDYSS